MEELGTAAWPDRFGDALRAWSTKTLERPIPTLSLFTGAGGLDLGFHDAGFLVHTMVEIEHSYAKTLIHNSQKGHTLAPARVACQDIREFSGEGLPPTEFIIGGPPCQTFSAAGRRSHGVLGTDDPRGILFQEYVRMLEQLRPRGFLFENVYGIEGAQSGTPWRMIVDSFSAAGYSVFHRILDAADFGVPQHRERLFIVGVRDGEFGFPRPTHGPDSPEAQPHFDAGTAISDLEGQPLGGPDSVGGRYGHLLAEIPPGLNYSFFTEKLGHPRPVFAWRSKFSDFLYKADPDAPVRTVKAKGGLYTGPFHWNNRPFTLPELKRLQTFPDDYEIVGGRQRVIEQIGNSVPPQIARVLAMAVLDDVFDVPAPRPLPRLLPAEKLTFRQLKRARTAMYLTKAKLAIDEMKPTPDGQKSKDHRRQYLAKLTAGFDLVESDDGPIAVSVAALNSNWTIKVRERDVDSHSPFAIHIRGDSKRAWDLAAETVDVVGSSLTPIMFTAAWKAFERELLGGSHKADLVQLNGYYQYPPHLAASMELSEDADSLWRVVQQVVQGVGVRSPSNVSTLAFVWGLPPGDVSKICDFLRSLGYEVRNRRTNPQIPDGHYLIPYAFPTLASTSVQLRKRLR